MKLPANLSAMSDRDHNLASSCEALSQNSSGSIKISDKLECNIRGLTESCSDSALAVQMMTSKPQDGFSSIPNQTPMHEANSSISVPSPQGSECCTRSHSAPTPSKDKESLPSFAESVFAMPRGEATDEKLVLDIISILPGLEQDPYASLDVQMPVANQQIDKCESDDVFLDIESLGPGVCGSLPASEDLGLLPAPLSGTQSISWDMSHCKDVELDKHLMLLRHQCQENYVQRMMRRGELPDMIAAASQQLFSLSPSLGSPWDGDCSCLSVKPESAAITITTPTESDSDSHYESQSDSFQYSVQEAVSGSEGSSCTDDPCALFDTKKALTALQAATGCQWHQCPAQHCIQGRVMLHHISCCLESTNPHAASQNVLLRAIADHATLCDELKCPVAWCSFFNEHDLPFEDQLSRLHASYFLGSIALTSEDSVLNNGMPLMPGVQWKEHVDWFPIVRLGTLKRTVLAVSARLDKPDYWVVKQEKKGWLQHVEVLRRLRGHPRIVRHLWILEQDHSLYVCASFEGASVADRMRELGQAGLTPGLVGLPLGRVLRYMEELTSAAKFLHRMRVVYLTWTVENVLLSADLNHVKLCNFSCAMLLGENDDEDLLEDLKLSLPPRIVPPELYQGEVVTEASDVWGLGCVCHELATGHMLYDQYRHDHPADIRELLEECRPTPDVADILDTTLRDIVMACLQMEPDHRMAITMLHEDLVHSLVCSPDADIGL